MAEVISSPDAVWPLPYFVAQADVFPLGQLDHRRFEVLAEQLLKGEQKADSAYDAVALMAEGADRGRDIVLYRSGRPVGVVQCKRYHRSIGLGAIVDEAIKFVLAGILDPNLLPDDDVGFSYGFWTAFDLTAEGRRLFDETDAMMATVAILVPDAVKRLRKKYKSLRPPHEQTRAGQDLDAEAVQVALTRLPKWTWTHTGGEAIAAALNRQRDVRRRFFRGHNDPDRVLPAEVDALFDALRDRQILDWEERNRAITIEKVQRRTLDQHYEIFLASGKSVMAVIGGAGLGKSSWAIQLLGRSKPGLQIHLLRGEDIDPGDDNALQSLLRVLSQRNPGEHAAGALAAGFWAWLDGDNRILVIDGLDRVGSTVRERLFNWLDNTLGLARYGPVRFVLTSRSEQWRALRPQLQGLEQRFFDPDSEGEFHFGQAWGGAVPLERLDDEETASFHAAFGLDAARRALRTPSLIANAARGADRGLTTRLAVFRSRLIAAETELHARGYGRWAVQEAFRHIGRLLLLVDDGRIDPAAIQAACPPGLLDALVAADILIPAGSYGRGCLSCLGSDKRGLLGERVWRSDYI